uniref:TBC1 domain family, member 16 n=1 Tax=Fundulus heteroclitus TaxID=8078 RepID=A0A3Q2R1P3_FUNHE
MSLGRLLRRASSKASDLLTLNPGAGGSSLRSGLDGEIIFSKNNVCVHPAEPIPGLAEHHPGYLCVHVEKDECQGSTLILTWVPNSRIQRQDEEALRYITPESSPVRRNARRRGRRTLCLTRSRPPAAAQQLLLAGEEGDEGSCELSDEVSRDSTMGSDSDTFSSPFCLSPVSEALCESSGSVFLDSESRELCEESMNHSVSSTSSLDSHAASEAGCQSQGMRWEEQQKLLALEQLCGVFRVDLGHMRSLRLFFSDDACTSGQLVIASRESQYKILHFHHAGLDKLAEVFQQWKCCRETQPKDQVRFKRTLCRK